LKEPPLKIVAWNMNQIWTYGLVVAEVDLAGLVDEHLADRDFVHVGAEDEEKHGRLDGLCIKFPNNILPKKLDRFTNNIT